MNERLLIACENAADEIASLKASAKICWIIFILANLDNGTDTFIDLLKILRDHVSRKIESGEWYD